VLVYFYYLISCYLGRFPDSVRIVCGQMKLTSAPNLGRRAAHLGGTVLRLRQNIFIFLRGRSFLTFKLECAPWFLNLWMPQNEKGLRQIGSTDVFNAREELKWEPSSYIGHLRLFFEDLGHASCPRGTTSQVSRRLLCNIFSKLRAKLSSSLSWTYSWILFCFFLIVENQSYSFARAGDAVWSSNVTHSWF